MAKSELTSRELALIGEKLLKAVRLADEEIDQIICSPASFARIRRSIEQRKAAAPETAIAAGPVHRWRPAFAALAVAGCVAAVIGVADVGLRPGDPGSAEVSEIETTPLGTAVVTSDERAESGQAQVASGAARSNRIKAARVHRPAARKPQPRPAAQADQGVFQAITYIGEGDVDEARVVRVKLPRSSLYAMGVKVPVENEGSEIKADLLIGADGVTKAVRLVAME